MTMFAPSRSEASYIFRRSFRHPSRAHASISSVNSGETTGGRRTANGEISLRRPLGVTCGHGAAAGPLLAAAAGIGSGLVRGQRCFALLRAAALLHVGARFFSVDSGHAISFLSVVSVDRE